MILHILFCCSRIDATDESHMGRYINDDDKTPSILPKKIVVDGKPTIVFFALRDIQPDEELTYDYGPGDHYWR